MIDTATEDEEKKSAEVIPFPKKEKPDIPPIEEMVGGMDEEL